MKILDYPIFILVSIFSRIRRWMLGPHAIGIVYDSANGILISGPSDMYVGGNLGFRGRYELDILAQLEALVTNQSRVLVLGSHIGSFAIPLAKKAREIVIYEANPDTFRLLQFNLKLSGINNCQAFNLAVGDKPGRVQFFANTVNSGGSKRAPVRSSFAFEYDRPKKIEVEMIRLSEHVSDPRFDLILMDIEGSEYFALQGMTPILEACSYLQFEYSPGVLERVAQVSDQELVALLGNWFKELRIQGTERRAQRSEFSTFFRQLQEEGERVDILAVR